MGQVRQFQTCFECKHNDSSIIPSRTDKNKITQAMSSRLCKSQFLEGPMLLWNRTSQVAIDQCKDNDSAKAVETITKAVAQSDIIWSCLADEEAVLSVYGEICKGDITGKLFVECSTITASGSETVAQKLKEKGAEFVTMPGKGCV